MMNPDIRPLTLRVIKIHILFMAAYCNLIFGRLWVLELSLLKRAQRGRVVLGSRILFYVVEHSYTSNYREYSDHRSFSALKLRPRC